MNIWKLRNFSTEYMFFPTWQNWAENSWIFWSISGPDRMVLRRATRLRKTRTKVAAFSRSRSRRISSFPLHSKVIFSHIFEVSSRIYFSVFFTNMKKGITLYPAQDCRETLAVYFLAMGRPLRSYPSKKFHKFIQIAILQYFRSRSNTFGFVRSGSQYISRYLVQPFYTFEKFK